MAVQNVYVDPGVTVGQSISPARSRNIQSGSGAKCVIMATSFVILSTDNNGSIYRLFQNVDANLIPLQAWIATTANTAGTSYGLGLYLPNLSTVTQPASGGATIFMSGQTFASAAASLDPKTALDGMATAWTTTAISKVCQRLFEWAGYTYSPPPTTSGGFPRAFDICLTAATVGTGGCTFAV